MWEECIEQFGNYKMFLFCFWIKYELELMLKENLVIFIVYELVIQKLNV